MNSVFKQPGPSLVNHQPQYQDVSIGERVILGFKVSLSVLFTLGISLAVSSSRSRITTWYDECITGKRKIKVLNGSGNNSIPVSKTVNNLGVTNLTKPNSSLLFSSPKPNLPSYFFPATPSNSESPLNSDPLVPIELPSHVKHILQEIRNDSCSFNLSEFEEVVKHGKNIINPIDKTTFFDGTEILSKRYLSWGIPEKAIQIRLQAARAVSPVTAFAEIGMNNSILGYAIQPLGTTSIKNHTIKVQNREYVNGKKCIRIEARLQDKARKDLQETIEILQKNPKLFTGIGFHTDTIVYHARESNNHQWGKKFKDIGSYSIQEKCQVIEFYGVGKISIGTNPNCHTEYKHLIIELDPNVKEEEAGAKLHIIFAALGLGSISSHSRPEDIERIKVMQIFRHFFPIESNQAQFKALDESVKSLKDRIVKNYPTMKGHFHHYLEQFPNKMYQQEVIPGQFVWCMDDLAKEAKNLGVKTLMSTIIVGNAQEIIPSILKTGVLSSQQRMSAGIIVGGLSTLSDFQTGGAEAIFTTLITKKIMDTIAINKFTYKGNVKIFYDLKLLERVGYNYSNDCYGAKDHRYVNPLMRQNLPNLVDCLNKNNNTSNEVCIHGRIGPEYIKGILVDSFVNKNSIIYELAQQGLIDKNFCINKIPVHKFIQVADWNYKYKESHWS